MSKTLPPVSKYMTTVPETIETGMTIAEAHKLMEKLQIRHLPVLDKGKLYGILTDRDIKLVLSFEGIDPERIIAYDVCVSQPFNVSPDTPLDEVSSEMAEKHYGCTIIMQNEKVVGIFTTVDACRALTDLLHQRYHQ